MKKCLVAAFAAVALLGSPAYAGSHGGSAKEMIATAKAEYDKALKVGYAWRDTGKFIKKAEEALAKGEDKKAMKLAKKAEFQAKASQQQAKDQANAGPRF